MQPMSADHSRLACLARDAVARLPFRAGRTGRRLLQGKTISLYVGFPPGGGYDIYARVIAPHFTRHIPGNPQIVIKNMLGGSGMRAATYMTGITPQDGTSLGLFLDSLTLGKVLGGPGEFDPVKLDLDRPHRLDRDRLGGLAHVAGADDRGGQDSGKSLMAGTVPSNSSSFIPAALNDLIGTKIKVILGFRGSPDQALAMLRGEVNSIGGMSWEAIQTNHQDWLTEKKIRVLYAQGAQRIRELPDIAGPARLCAMTSAAAASSACSAAAPTSAARSWPSPAFRRSARRRCARPSWRRCAIPNCVAEIQKRKLDLEPLSGEEVQKMVAASAATPRPLIEQAKRYIGQ